MKLSHKKDCQNYNINTPINLIEISDNKEKQYKFLYNFPHHNFEIKYVINYIRKTTANTESIAVANTIIYRNL